MIYFSQNGDLYYYAIDSCGNLFEEQKKVYDFRQKQTENVCSEAMVLIESSRGNFCIDQYAWENKKGVRPRNNISWQDARDSCLSLGKRLCSSEEWTVACKGPYNWKYPYGEKYIRQACVTQDSTYQKNGSAGECRGWYAIYDMVGNLSEWTNTRSKENNRFFIVKGGFYNSGNVADCDMSRYSYYPQNRHNQVGFRCCKDVEDVTLQQ
ncbi:MAG: SUMF1/EgtB/PvdO family nonheme iron enzyme [Chitinispirillales bacterium]|jgi:formylglycine-generating enzyme required for sulfatase activity|nr:SUMF1/EgtB/PvdO family nonheme iron enzyme [Chitinispirillales bacterium]